MGDNVVDLAALNTALEGQRPCVIIFPEHGLAALKDKEEASARIDHRQAAVQRDVKRLVV